MTPEHTALVATLERLYPQTDHVYVQQAAAAIRALAGEVERANVSLGVAVAACAELHHERDTLRAELEAAQKLAQFECVARHEAYVEWDRLKAEVAALRKDAERSGAVIDIIRERQRQVSDEGWTADHDDAHQQGILAQAAACYAAHASGFAAGGYGKSPYWPFDEEWWKPKDARRDLVRSAALIVAEIERFDRDKAAIDAALADKRGNP